MFVLDINVVSEIRKIRLGRAAPNVAQTDHYGLTIEAGAARIEIHRLVS